MLPVRERIVWRAKPEPAGVEVPVEAVLRDVLGRKEEPVLWEAGSVRAEGDWGIGPSRLTVPRILSAR